MGRSHPSVTTQVIVTQHAAFQFRPYSHICFSGTSVSEEEEPRRALDYKDGENKEDELPAACQIQSEQPKDSSRHQSEASQNRSRLQTASACTVNWAACVTRLYKHVNKTAAYRDTVWWQLQGTKVMILKSVRGHFKVLCRFGISMPEKKYL